MGSWTRPEPTLPVLDRAHPVSQIPDGPIHPDSQRFNFQYLTQSTCYWRVRAKNQYGFGRWTYWGRFFRKHIPDQR